MRDIIKTWQTSARLISPLSSDIRKGDEKVKIVSKKYTLFHGIFDARVSAYLNKHSVCVNWDQWVNEINTARTVQYYFAFWYRKNAYVLQDRTKSVEISIRPIIVRFFCVGYQFDVTLSNY